jgi:hypothetical protein
VDIQWYSLYDWILKCELEKDQKRLEEFSQDELDMADMYINRTLDSALVELIGEVEE